MSQKQEPVKPAGPLALRALGKAFQSVGEKQGIETFIEAGENLLHAANDLDQPPSQDVDKSSKWIFETIFLASVGCVVTLLLGWLVNDYWSAAWAIGPVFLMMLALPWYQESSRRKEHARDAFFLLQEWRKKRF